MLFFWARENLSSQKLSDLRYSVGEAKWEITNFCHWHTVQFFLLSDCLNGYKDAGIECSFSCNWQEW